MELELHQLDRRHESLRRQSPQVERALLASLADRGQQVPILVVVAQEKDRFRVIDGFKRLRCLERLGVDTVGATLLDLAEQEALVLDWSQRASEKLTPLELGWLLSTLRDGHADATTTAQYDRRDETAKRRAVQSLTLPLAA